MILKHISEAANLVKSSKFLIAFTGAGISVESGIPPFRGKNGIWNKYDPELFDLNFYLNNPTASLQLHNMFYEVMSRAKPNAAHLALAELERMGILKGIITQNIDNLHFVAGNKNIVEFHGNTRYFVCLNCGKKYPLEEVKITDKPPMCPACGGLLKPDFVFFGEPIPSDAYFQAMEWARETDVMLVIGTTGVVYPAARIPHQAKKYGAKIIEINLDPSAYTAEGLTDIFLQGKATEVMTELLNQIKNSL